MPDSESDSLHLEFGILELDRLISSPERGKPRRGGIKVDKIGEKYEGSSICILGPDGTGKSILAMHLASQYLYSNLSNSPRVLYFSTDLSYARAKATWDAFGLDNHPARWDGLPDFAKETPRPTEPNQIELQPINPLEIDIQRTDLYLNKSITVLLSDYYYFT